ncbi:MAG: VCBS repeat-containing protein, partial [Acidobacteriota bacterium]
MSSNAPHDHDDPHASHPDDDHDDAVIGKALRLSLIALVALGVIGGAIAFFFTRPTEAPPEQVIEVAAPEAVAQAAADPPSVTFADVTASIGIDFIHESGAKGDKLLPESMGSGAAFADLDNDGDNDLVLINGSRWPHDGGAESPAVVVYRNDAGGDGAIALTDVTAAIGLADVRLYGTGLAIADVDGDGWRDLFIAAVGGNRLLRNVDGQRFVDITRQAGVAGADDAWSTSAGFADLDRDGDLDLYVCNYVRWSKDIDFAVDFRLTGVGRAYGPPVNYEGTFSQLYRNDGDGTFTDVSEEAGIRVTNDATGGPVGKGLGLIFVDIDRDGWLDIFVANDTVQNFVFRNRGGEADGALAFEEVGQLYGLAYGRAGEATGAMGIDVAHYRNDGELGMAIGNFANEMTSLYISQGDPTLFADEAIV